MSKLEEIAWRPIGELTDAIFDEFEWQLRLLVANDCNGPHLVSSGDLYMDASDLKNDPWDFFIILPDIPALSEANPEDA